MDLYLKLGLILGCSSSIFVVMMVLQNRKELEAQRKFELTLKSKGLSLDVEEK